MKYLKRFDESWNPFGKDDSSPKTADEVKVNSSLLKNKINGILQNEAEKQFNKVIKKLNNKLIKSKKGYIKVYQNPTFKTRGTDSVNYILMKMVKKYYEEKGFKVDHSYDGNHQCKYDWFIINANY